MNIFAGKKIPLRIPSCFPQRFIKRKMEILIVSMTLMENKIGNTHSNTETENMVKYGEREKKKHLI